MHGKYDCYYYKLKYYYYDFYFFTVKLKCIIAGMLVIAYNNSTLPINN